MKNDKLHVGIILDGNRRFAKAQGLNNLKGHEYGARVLERLFDWIDDFDIGEFSFFLFSLENFKRSVLELTALMKLFKRYFKKLLNDKRIFEKKIKVNFAGDLQKFDSELQSLMADVMEKTKSHDEFVVNFCMGYCGRNEIVSAVRSCIEKGNEINEENIQKNLWISDEPDFIIRTGKQIRLSGFLPWQSVYSEWIFLDKFWPEFTREDLVNCIKEFKLRQRNFGR